MSQLVLTGAAVQLLTTAEPDDFRTREVPALTLELAGIPGDRHYGFTRPAGPRERWYKDDTPMRSGRQLSIVSAEELAAIAARMELAEIDPAWIGANIVIAGIADFTCLPWGTRLFFKGGASLVHEGENAPCSYAGEAIAAANPGRSGLDLLFVKAAKGRRGIVATVECAGTIKAGPVRLKLPPTRPWNGNVLS
jgi:hypothetical protein